MGTGKKITDLYVLKNEEIRTATKESYRQYFCGNLQRPQILDYISTEALEIGTSDYRVFTADTPHFHTRTADMLYILKGEFHVLLIEEKTTVVLQTGDFISIPPRTPYASKAAAGTQTLFIKVTEKNDKVNVETDPEIENWLRDEI